MRTYQAQSLQLLVGRYIAALRIGQGRHAGQPFRLLGWQRKFLHGAFGQDGDGALTMGRGGGKTTFVAAIACAAVDVDGPLVEPMAETLVVGSSFEQGLIGFRHMLHFLAPTFERYGRGPRGRFRVQDSANRASIQDKETGALVRVLGSDPGRLHGAAPRILLLDELAQWPTGQVASMLAALIPSAPREGSGCRRPPSAAGPTAHSACYNSTPGGAGATPTGAPGPVLCVVSLVPRRFRMAFAAGPIWCFDARVSAPTGQPAPVRLTL